MTEAILDAPFRTPIESDPAHEPPTQGPPEPPAKVDSDPLAVLDGPMLDQLCGRWPEDLGPAGKLQLALRSTGLTLALMGVFAAAVGSSDPVLAVTNAVKLPILLVVSTATAVPAGLLAWKLTDSRLAAVDVLGAIAAGNLAGALVLAVLSPLVAIYTHTTIYWGPGTAILSAGTAFGIGLLTTARLLVRPESPEWRLRQLLPFMVSAGVMVSSLMQLVWLTGPFLPSAVWFARLAGVTP